MKPMTRFLAVAMAIATAATIAVAAPVTWKIDRNHTEVGFEVRHFFSRVHGRFHEVEGTIVFDEANPDAIQVDATVQVASVDTGNQKRDTHLQGPDFFEVEKNPTLKFKSTKVTSAGKGKYKVAGDLTMRGVTKPVVFDGEFLGSAPISVKGQSRGSKAGFAASATVNRKDFGINWNQALDGGGFVLDDNVTIVLNVEADLSEPVRADAGKSQ